MAESDELTPGDRIDVARRAAHSLALLLEAIDGGDVVATQFETARLRGAVEALEAIVGRPDAES
jgi:hypothetical protein